MPLPRPRKGESRDEFIARVMGDEKMVAEYPDEKQRSSVLIGAVSRAHKRVIQEEELADARGRITDEDRRENIRILGKVIRGEPLAHEEQRFISAVGTDARLLEEAN